MKTLANKFNKWGLGKETMREAQNEGGYPMPPTEDYIPKATFARWQLQTIRKIVNRSFGEMKSTQIKKIDVIQ